MATIKSYTDLSQSKTLAEILPIESADMFYALEGVIAVTSPYIKENLIPGDPTATPCWSLAALLNILPNYEINNFGDGIQLAVNKEAFVTEDDETLLDLVVNMIIHLYELKCCDYEEKSISLTIKNCII